MAFSSTEQELISFLRDRLTDRQCNIKAFTLSLSDTRAQDIEVRIGNGMLTTLVTNGTSEDLTIDLSEYDTSTVGSLIEYIKTKEGYIVSAERDVDLSHPSDDLKIFGYGDALKGGVEFRHRRWSDTELYGIIKQGVERHNPSYTPGTVPDNETQYVLNLAHTVALRQMASNAVKRRGLDQTVKDLIKLADSIDNQYQKDRKRHERAIPVAEIRDDDVGAGDIVQGEQFRRSARTGFVAPMSANLPPEPPVLLIRDDSDIEDTRVTVVWKRARDYDFYAAELWRDTVEDVKRTRTGVFAREPTAVERGRFGPTSSKLIFQTFGANSNFDTVAFATFLEEFGQLITRVVDGEDRGRFDNRVRGLPPEPDTTYYYRLYFVDINYEIVDSQTIQVHTKAMRARIDESNPITPTFAEADSGQEVVIRGKRFHEGMSVRLGDKEADNLVVESSTEARFTIPEVFNELAWGNAVDITITSINGLADTQYQVFRYDAPT